MDDAAEFSAVEAAMKNLGFTPEESHSMFSLTAAILHLGNLEFNDSGNHLAQTLLSLFPRTQVLFLGLTFQVIESVC